MLALSQDVINDLAILKMKKMHIELTEN